MDLNRGTNMNSDIVSIIVQASLVYHHYSWNVDNIQAALEGHFHDELWASGGE